jgi:thiamine-phosphate pyrophosphorylase
MPFKLPAVYPISPESLSGRALLSWAEALLGAGCRLLQYRRKSGADAELLVELKHLVGLAHDAGAVVIVDDRPDLCLLTGADGVHLGQQDLPAEEVRRLLPRTAVLGVSTHTEEQFLEALDLPADYLALGPVCPTASKERPDPVVPVPLQERLLRLAGGRPVVAIGGVTPGNAGALLRRGFSSVAVISALERSPGDAYRSFMAAVP